MKELQFRVAPYGSRGNYYSIEYRRINKGFMSTFNFLIMWKYLTRTYHSGMLTSYPDRDHPVLHSSFDCAVSEAEGYKKNPQSLADFMKEEDLKYRKTYSEYEQYQNSRNRTKKI
jgi:hypothetical protein